jgi:uncharacterized protein (DUF1697 family)
MADRARSKPSDRHVALLRGINVGGKNKLPMKDLAALFDGAGCGDVVTYIQSGNVVYSAKPALARRVPELISNAIESELGLHVPVIVRSAEELASAAAAIPFAPADCEARLLYVAFLRDRPTAAQIAGLDPERSPRDEFRVVGREVYLKFAGGAADTKLTNAYFDGRLATVSTMRNWNTVTKLLELVRA